MYKELGGFTQDAVVPLGLYGLQLALNWAWPVLFFGAHKLKWVFQQCKCSHSGWCSKCPYTTPCLCRIQAFVNVILVTGTVGATMASWYPISRTGTLLMVPYLSWLCFVTCLNYCIWRDNPDKKDE